TAVLKGDVVGCQKGQKFRRQDGTFALIRDDVRGCAASRRERSCWIKYRLMTEEVAVRLRGFVAHAQVQCQFTCHFPALLGIRAVVPADIVSVEKIGDRR